MTSVLPLISPEKGAQLGFIAQGTLLVISGVYYPVSVLPDWMQWLSTISPATYALRGIRHAILDGAGITSLWGDIWPLIIIGVVAAYWGGWLDEVIMRLNDVALAFPQILLALLVLTAVDQPSWYVIVLLVGVSHAPRVARLARGVALGIVSRDYVTAAEALGESRVRVVLAEVLPNMNAPLLAEAGLRLTYSIGLIAGIGFLGFASNPSAADWGYMINENRLALLVQPWGVLAPVIIIGVFTIGTNLMADGIAQLSGRGD